MVANKQCLLLCCRFYGYLEITTGFGDSDRIWRCDFYFWRLRFYLEIEIELGDRYFVTRDTWPLCATVIQQPGQMAKEYNAVIAFDLFYFAIFASLMYPEIANVYKLNK